MKTAELMRWAGLAAIAAGFLFIAIQIVHPPDILSSVTTGRWAIVHVLGVTMSFLALLGITGIYASQVEKAGWVGLAGYLLFSLFWALTIGLSIRRSFYLAGVGDGGTEVCAGLLGDGHWCRQRG